MVRNRASAKKAGSGFEQQVADYLSCVLDDERIERRVKRGNKDRGDIAGVTYHGERVVIECKAESRVNLWGYLEEAEVERGNDDAALGVVVVKVPGRGPKGTAWQLAAMPWGDFEEKFPPREEFATHDAGVFDRNDLRGYTDLVDVVTRCTKRGDPGTAVALMPLREFAAELAGGACLLNEEAWSRKMKG